MKRIIRSSTLSEDKLQKVHEIAERYCTSKPVSGDWKTETLHEQRAISKELGISMQEAKKLMIEELGFSPKEFVKSSTITSSINYTDHYFQKVDGQKFSIYTAYSDDADNFQCQISEIHPYDDADYYWIQKDSPVSAKVVKSGKVVDRIGLREWDDEAMEEYNEDDHEFVNDLIQYMCKVLRDYNKNIEPRIIHW